MIDEMDVAEWREAVRADQAARRWAVVLHGPIRSARQTAAAIEDAAEDLSTATMDAARWDAIGRWVRACYERHLDAELRRGGHGWTALTFEKFAATFEDEELAGRGGDAFHRWRALFVSTGDLGAWSGRRAA